MLDCLIFNPGRLYIPCEVCGAVDGRHVVTVGDTIRVLCVEHCPVHTPAAFEFAGEITVVNGEQESLF